MFLAALSGQFLGPHQLSWATGAHPDKHLPNLCFPAVGVVPHISTYPPTTVLISHVVDNHLYIHIYTSKCVDKAIAMFKSCLWPFLDY